MPYKDPEKKRAYHKKYGHDYYLRVGKFSEAHKRLAARRITRARSEAKLAGFRSGFERTLDTQLKHSGTEYSYETLKISYTIDSVYTPDFILKNGIIIEAKGLLSKEDRRKMKAIQVQHPSLDIRFCFMQANQKIPGSKSTHAQWAQRNGFKWSDQRIPQEWIDE